MKEGHHCREVVGEESVGPAVVDAGKYTPHSCPTKTVASDISWCRRWYPEPPHNPQDFPFLPSLAPPSQAGHAVSYLSDKCSGHSSAPTLLYVCDGVYEGFLLYLKCSAGILYFFFHMQVEMRGGKLLQKPMSVI